VKDYTTGKIKKELDAIFSKYIRQKYAVDGMVSCYTCGKIFEIKRIQNGHFVSRKHLATRWSEENCRPQCWGCNGFGRGMTLEFEEGLIKEYGRDKVEAIKQSRHQTLKLDREWYLDKIEHYARLIE